MLSSQKNTPLSTSLASSSSSPSVKTPRISRACEACRRRKIKCSGGVICSSCSKANEECHYRTHYRAKDSYSIKLVTAANMSGSRRNARQRRESSTSSGSETSSTSVSASPTTSTESKQELDMPNRCVLPGIEDLLNPKPFSDKQLPEWRLPAITNPKRHFSSKILGVVNETLPPIFQRFQTPQSATVNQDAHLNLPESVRLNENDTIKCIDRYFAIHHQYFPFLDSFTIVSNARQLYKNHFKSILKQDRVVIYAVISLGAQELDTKMLGPYSAKQWSMVYFNRCISDLQTVPHGVQHIQTLGLCSLFQTTLSSYYSQYYCDLALKQAIELQLNDPSTLASDYSGQLHRTWVFIYLWHQLLCFATDNRKSLDSCHSPIPIPQAYASISYPNLHLLSGRLQMLDILLSPPGPSLNSHMLYTTFGDRSRYLQSVPPTDFMYGNNSISWREWKLFRMTFFLTEMMVYTTMQTLNWGEPSELSGDAAQRLFNLISEEDESGFDDWLAASFAKSCLVQAFSTGEPSRRRFSDCVNILGLGNGEYIWKTLHGMN